MRRRCDAAVHRRYVERHVLPIIVEESDAANSGTIDYVDQVHTSPKPCRATYILYKQAESFGRGSTIVKKLCSHSIPQTSKVELASLSTTHTGSRVAPLSIANSNRRNLVRQEGPTLVYDTKAADAKSKLSRSRMVDLRHFHELNWIHRGRYEVCDRLYDCHGKVGGNKPICFSGQRQRRSARMCSWDAISISSSNSCRRRCQIDLCRAVKS